MLPKREESVSKGVPYKSFAIFGGLLSVAAFALPFTLLLPRLGLGNVPATPLVPLVIQSLGSFQQGLCGSPAAAPTQLTDFENFAVEVAMQVDDPVQGLELLLKNWEPKRLASLAPRAWPEIHERARAAKVPIVMYHDILPEKEVFFDVTPEELRSHFELIRSQGVTPITLDQLIANLRTGVPLPEKPILLTFDDGYGGHYEYVYPLLKEYGYPAVFSIYTSNMGEDTGRTHVSWEQLKAMASDPLVTVAAHSITHPPDLRVFSDDELQKEVTESKRLLEKELGIPIHYFTYPAGKYDERVTKWVEAAGYQAALTMRDADEQFAGESEDLLTIERFGQSRLEEVMAEAWGGPPLPRWDGGFDFSAPVTQNETTIDQTNLILISGGKPATIHADSRYQVPEILEGTEAIAAVDGGFFSLEFLDSNVMIGPVLSKDGQQFIPGNGSENPRLAGRPLVLISPEAVKFIPFEAAKHNTQSGVASELESVTDAFVAAAWLVKEGQSQTAATFGTLYGFDADRHRAFWGINEAGQPAIGVSKEPIDAVTLGALLAKAGFRDAVMLDSGASTSLAYQGESLVAYTPRPVPHVVALFPPDSACLSVENSESGIQTSE